MAILDIQRRLHESGRIRIGAQVPVGKTGKTRPAKLDSFRLTSPDKALIERAAKLYGGTVGPWEAPAGQQWEVITETTTLPVIVPPTDMGFSQWYELWSGGGCQRRCDGANETISDGPCLCDPDKRECTIHTRLSVLLADLVGLGLWRLDTQGWNAALELQGAVEVLHMATQRGQMLPASLRLEQRVQKRPGQQTRRFAVPVLDVEISPAQLVAGVASDTIAGKQPPRQLDASAPLTPVPDSVREHPAGTIAEQIAPPAPPKRRGQITVPATGVPPRTAAQAAAADTPRSAVAAPAATVDSSPLSAVAAQHQVELDELRDGIIDERKNNGRKKPAPRAKEPAPEEPQEYFAVPPQFPIEEPPTDLMELLPDNDGPLINSAQLTKLSILLKEAGFTDRESRHDFVNSAIGRPISSAKELTKNEASDVIDILEKDREK